MRRLIRHLLTFWLALLTALGCGTGWAQYSSDIDIYGTPIAAEDAPNVLIVLDNTANWSPMFTREMAALVNTFNLLPPDKFRVGLMMFTETGSGDSNVDGSYVRAAIRPLDAAYITKLGNLLNSFDVGNDKSNSGKAGLAMSEAYNYFAGKAPFAGNGKNKTDYTGNTYGSTASRAIYALANNALSSKSGTPYRSPIISSCARNYIIYISNGAVQESASDSSTAASRLSAAYSDLRKTRPGNITGLSPSGSQDNMADEWARFMKNAPQAITTFTLDVDPVTTGQGPGWSALLGSIAHQSGGQYYKVDSTVNGGAKVVESMLDIFNQIQAVNSVFASASLPVSVNARGTYLNQVFVGMFRPDGSASPRWRGNLKQYKFGYDASTDTLSLVDSVGNDAISGATGFISPSAVSFWTTSSTFWINQPLGTPESASDSPDGEVVEKGGMAQGLRTAYPASQTSRNIYTCLSCAANTALGATATTQFVVSNTGLTTAALGVSTSTERDALINWVRGTDNVDDELGPGGTVTIRPGVHGDVLHSRPAVVNYGGATGVVVFYGANDGFLHAVNGNQTGTDAGRELWSFLPAEHLAKLKRLRDNTPAIRLSTTVLSTATGAVTPLSRDYFVDGPLEVYQKINVSGTTTQAILYAGMRRGGRFIYALDVTTPGQPRFLWSKSHTDYSVLGQTWSAPKLARLKGRTNPVIIMGAGYDPVAEDAASRGSVNYGNAVLVLDALDGSLVKQFATERSVPADVSLVDTDYDGFIDRAYAADVGGNLYRIDLETPTSTAVSNWSIYKHASLTGGSTRKFFFPPDVVLTKNFTALMAGTGDREKPLATSSRDRFFTVYDSKVSKGSPTGTFTAILSSDLGRVGSDDDMTKGCYIPMNENGEKIINAPLTVAGVTYFSTNRPDRADDESCKANLGVAKVYSAPLFCKSAKSETLIGGGLPPSFVSGVVEVSTSDSQGNPVTKKQTFIIGAPNSKGSAIEGTKVAPSTTPSRRRTYWYLENAR